jgi:hypothetical protein
MDYGYGEETLSGWSFGGQVSFGDIRDINALSRVLVMDMISNAGGLNRNGLLEWIIQRITSVVITAYIFFCNILFIGTPRYQLFTVAGLNSPFSNENFKHLDDLIDCYPFHNWTLGA